MWDVTDGRLKRDLPALNNLDPDVRLIQLLFSIH
jgi:hypothetical protein